MWSEGKGVSPVFSMPFMTSAEVAIDWLHCCDLGVAQDFLGNCFVHLLTKINGSTQAEQVQALFDLIWASYARRKTESRLDNLTPLMLRKKAGSTPKLRSKAGESRGLVPVARELCDQFLLGNDPVDVAVKYAASLLDDCYSMLSVANFCHDSLKEACRTFCLLYTSLEAHVGDGVSWAFKPKFHIWQELCELSSTCPSTCWTYRDEDFGGSVAKLAHRRGGRNAAAATSLLVLQKFRAKHDPPRIL
jgi:hypothetical protein